MRSELGAVFQRLDVGLTHSQNLWRAQPFTSSELPWGHTHRHLKDALLNLTDEAVLQLHNCSQQRLSWFQEREPELCAALYAFEPAQTEHVTPLQPSGFDSVHIPGRKWQQIVAFAGALPPSTLPIVDWCAGKGHLSRIVQRSQQQTVHCLEWDAALIAAGRALAKQQCLEIHYHHHNVMEPPPAACTDTETTHIALHACGELHHQLVRHVAKTGARAVTLSPCCYHKVSTEYYQALSSGAQASQLRLNRVDLHLAVQDTVTARSGERRLREQERLWRLGFDALQREVRSSDNYLNVPSCKRELLRQDFPAFCQWAAERRQLKLPCTIDYDHYLHLGRERHREIIRLELLRQLFNRPLELWLVLDCALYLEEHGYRVKVTRFCETTVSPRNLLIQAEKH